MRRICILASKNLFTLKPPWNTETALVRRTVFKVPNKYKHERNRRHGNAFQLDLEDSGHACRQTRKPKTFVGTKLLPSFVVTFAMVLGRRLRCAPNVT